VRWDVAFLLSSCLAIVQGALQLNNGVWEFGAQNGAVPPTPTQGGYWHTAAGLGGDMYVIGGSLGGATFYYRASSGQWTDLGSQALLPVNLSASDLDVSGGVLFTFGGNATRGSVNDIYYFSPINPSKGWTPLVSDSLVSPRNGHTLTQVGGIMYVHGGWNGSVFFGDTWWFDSSVLYIAGQRTGPCLSQSTRVKLHHLDQCTQWLAMEVICGCLVATLTIQATVR